MPNDHDDAAARVNIHDCDTRRHVDDFGADNQHDYTSADNHDLGADNHDDLSAHDHHDLSAAYLSGWSMHL